MAEMCQEIMYDPAFAAFGQRVVANSHIKKIREHNLSINADEIKDWCPQEGFQESMLVNDADVLIVGGRRGSGKSLGIILAPIRNIDNPNFLCIGFRKEEDDIKNGIWKDSKLVYSRLATPRQSDFTWTFPLGSMINYVHLQNESEVDRRFRGLNIPFMIIDEVTQIKFETFFTLLASNRNSIGIRNQFIGTCNPTDADHWLYKFLWYYIDEESGDIRQDRNGKKIYFYKYGETINEIYWGETKYEVYLKAKGNIEEAMTSDMVEAGVKWENMINSLCFIEGKYSENKIFIKNDPNYLGNLLQTGGDKAIKDVRGKWGGIKSGNCEISSEDFQKLFTNTEQRTGERFAVADVALSSDEFIIGAFDGNHLYALECFVGVGSMTAAALVKNFLDKHHIEESHFAFDSDGVGQYLKEPFHADMGGAIAFNNNSSASDKQIWANLKSECIDKFIRAIREGDISIDKAVQNKIMPDGRTFREHLEEQRKVLVKKQNSTKNQYIMKREMKLLLGKHRSPDDMDMMYMQRIFGIRNIGFGGFTGLGALKLFN